MACEPGAAKANCPDDAGPDVDIGASPILVKLASGKIITDEAAAQQEVLVALKAVAEWHNHAKAVKAVGPDHPELQRLYQAVEKLKHSSSNVVRARAQETYLSLGQK